MKHLILPILLFLISLSGFSQIGTTRQVPPNSSTKNIYIDKKTGDYIEVGRGTTDRPFMGPKFNRMAKASEIANAYRTISANLFNNAGPGIVDGYYIDTLGVFHVDNSFIVSEFIRIIPGTLFTPSAESPGNPRQFIAIYDSSQTIIPTGVGKFNRSTDGIVLPAKALYVRLAVPKSILSSFAFRAGSAVGYTPFLALSTAESRKSLRSYRKALRADVLSKLITKGKNLFNKTDPENSPNDNYINDKGESFGLPDYFITHWIEGKPSTVYTATGSDYVAFTDSLGTPLRVGAVVNRGTNSFTTTAATGGFYATIPLSQKSFYQIQEGSSLVGTPEYTIDLNATTPQGALSLSVAADAKGKATYSANQVVQSANLYNKDDLRPWLGIVKYKYVSQFGIEVADNAYFITPYIPSIPNLPYTPSVMQLVAYYGARDPITGIPVPLGTGELNPRASATIYPPAGAEFMRFTVPIANLNNFKVTQGTSVTGVATTYSKVLDGETAGGRVALSVATQLPATKNLFNISKATTGAFVNTDGTITASGAYSYSDTIPVKPLTKYVHPYRDNVAFIGVDSIGRKRPLKIGASYLRDSIWYQTTADTYFIVATVPNNIKAQYQIEEGTKPTYFVPYGQKLSPNLMQTTGTDGMNGVIWGTSILWNNGYSYWQKAGDFLGMYFKNAAIPSSRLRAFNKNHSWTGEDWHIVWSLTQTLAQKDSIITNWATIWPILTGNPPHTLSDADKAYIRSTSYESSLAELATANVVIIGHGYNDVFASETMAEYLSMPTDTSTAPHRSRNRDTYLGAFNFLMDEIYKVNPDITVLIDGHFENQRDPQVAQAQELLAKKWELALARNWERTGWSQELIPGTASKWSTAPWNGYTLKAGEAGYPSDMTRLRYALPDATHLYSDPTGKAENVMVKLAAYELRRLFPPIPTTQNTLPFWLLLPLLRRGRKPRYGIRKFKPASLKPVLHS